MPAAKHQTGLYVDRAWTVDGFLTVMAQCGNSEPYPNGRRYMIPGCDKRSLCASSSRIGKSHSVMDPVGPWAVDNTDFAPGLNEAFPLLDTTLLNATFMRASSLDPK